MTKPAWERLLDEWMETLQNEDDDTTPPPTTTPTGEVPKPRDTLTDEEWLEEHEGLELEEQLELLLEEPDERG